jgi:outer membrane protein TolC
VSRLLYIGKITVIVGLLLLIISCSHTPLSLTEDELSEVISLQDQLQQFEQEPITKPLTLAEAVARALKYNLDLKQRTFERLEKISAAEIVSYSQWPELALQAQHNDRDTYSGGQSLAILPGGKSLGPESLESSTSSERHLLDASAEFSWNILDFGLSYVRARQASNEVMIYREEERKVMARLVQEVRSLYWLAASSQQVLPALIALHKDTNIALDKTQYIINERLKSPLDQLTYVRNLLDIKKQTETLISELGSAQIRLGALMNIQPGEHYELAEYTQYQHYEFSMPVEKMERAALQNRAEIRSLAYQKRILQDEGKAAILELLPGLKLYAGVNYTSNEYTFDNNWHNVGAQVSWNLMNAFKYPVNMDLLAAREQALKAQQLSLSMAIIVQVHLALHEHRSSANTFNTSFQYAKAQEGIAKQMESELISGRISTQSLLYERLNTALAQLERDVAYANMEKSLADLFASIGLDPLPSRFDNTSVDGIAEQLNNHWLDFVDTAESVSLDSADRNYKSINNDEYSLAVMPSSSQLLKEKPMINNDGYTLNLASFKTEIAASNYAKKLAAIVVYDGKFYCVVKGEYPSLAAARVAARQYKDAFARRLEILHKTVGAS